MITIPNQSSIAKAYEQFDDDGSMKPSAYYDRVVDVMEEIDEVHPSNPIDFRLPRQIAIASARRTSRCSKRGSI